MKSQVIWYLHHYAGAPSLGMSYRPYYLCKQFTQNGFKPYVIGASFHHLLHVETEQHVQINHQVVDSQDYIFIKTPIYKGNTYKRIINMFSYAWKVWRYQKELVKITGIPSTIIISSSHPLHYFSARSIAKKYNAQLIFEVRDLWPLSLTDLLNVSLYHPFILLLGYIEKSAYKQTDMVVSLLSNAFSYMSQKGLTKDRFTYISNGVEVSESLDEKVTLKTSHAQVIADKKQQGYFLFGYVGSHGIPNSLDDLMQALLLLKNEGIQNFHFILVGKGEQKQALFEFAQKNNLSSVTFLDSLPKNQVYSFLHEMDALYLGWKNKSIYKYGISPNKIFEYMLSAKPILHAYSGEGDMVALAQAGLIVEAENPHSIAKGIKQMVGLTSEELQTMGEKGREKVLSDFTYEALSKKYMQLFEKKNQSCKKVEGICVV